jgi:type II secretory pathway pseudopilin PulG
MLSDRPQPAAPGPTATPAAPTAAPPASAGRLTLADERGFTMIELLVSMITGLVVCFALYAILQVATEQSSRLTDYAQSTQQGRLAMTKILDELHSSCLTPGFAPIQNGSGKSELRFINAFSEEAVIAKSQINEHRIVWNEEAGTLTDYIYPAVKEVTWPKFEYSSTPSPAGGVVLARNITQTETGGKKVPIFQYYSYNDNYNESAETGLTELNTTPLAMPLTETTAPTAASVLITFTAGPSDGKVFVGAAGKGVTDNLQSQVTLSFSVPVSNNTVIDSPCK